VVGCPLSAAMSSTDVWRRELALGLEIAVMRDGFAYIVVGGGLAGASAVKGIREIDQGEPILLVGSERHLPYNRPPLTKDLWSGKENVGDIFVNDQGFYDENGVQLALGTTATRIDLEAKSVILNTGESVGFGKLLLATGGVPRKLDIPGGDLEGIYYYRYLDHYRNLRSEATAGKSALVIGGGFIGSEIAAALNMNDVEVTMVFPESYLVQRVFPAGLGQALRSSYQKRGVRVLSGDVPTSIERHGSQFITHTKNGQEVRSDLVLAGIGITPSVELAEHAGLQVDDGVVVSEYLQSSHPDIYAAGDNTRFPYIALGKLMRVEHWDNAKEQGRAAGRNMAGQQEKYTYMPYFYSDLFEFGYEAVGEISSRLDTCADWQEENVTGIIYYLKDNRVRGVMTCNVWEKLDEARDMIRRQEEMSPEALAQAIAQ
jgi:3-phenylpropionate/trans-cinnamate dioxygenase ferredoxin reductase subunit